MLVCQMETAKREELFANYFKNNTWGDPESKSGPGSTLKYTESLRSALPEIISKHNIRSILDIPCGDFNWMSKVDIPSHLNYVGGDIVKEIVELNNIKHGKENIRFEHMDLLTSHLPSVDLVICRDCLFHFPIEDNIVALNNIKASGSKYLLMTDFPWVQENTTIALGHYCPYNYSIAPFNFKEPLASVDDWIEGFNQRRMALYDISAMNLLSI